MLHRHCVGMQKFNALSILLTANFVVIVKLLSRVELFVTPWTAACQTFWSFAISQSLLKLMFILDDTIKILHCTTPGLSVLHYLPEVAEIHVHVG